jgi:hypothetical protein
LKTRSTAADIRLRLIVIAAALGAAVLAGCGGGGRAGVNRAAASGAAAVTSPSRVVGAPTTAPAVPSVPPPATDYPADVPLTGHNVRPGEKPPVYPAEARARTEAGANAFAAFFIRTMDWAYATTNPSYMRHYSGASCGLCAGLETGIDKTAALKNWYEGGRLTVISSISTPIGGVLASADHCSLVAFDLQASTIVDKSGKIYNAAGAYRAIRGKLCEKYVAHGWKINYMARI